MENPYKLATISFLQTANYLNGEIADILRPLNISLQQLKILSIIFEQPEHKATVNAIRSRMLDPVSNVSRLLNKLMEKNYIKKIRLLNDQRVVLIYLTKSGIDLMHKGKKLLDNELGTLCTLSKRELKLLVTLLEKIRTV